MPELMRQAARPETFLFLAIVVFAFGARQQTKVFICLLIFLAILLSLIAG